MSAESVSYFIQLVKSGNFDDAAELLADDVLFTTPKLTFKSKQEWKKKFPPLHKKGGGPEFSDEIEPGDKDNQLIRKGKAKMMGRTISLMQVIEVSDEGKIIRIALKKA